MLDKKIQPGKFTPFLFSLLFCSVIFLIPDSRASTFFQIWTPIGTITPDKVLLILGFFLFLSIVLFRNQRISLSGDFGLFSSYFFWVLLTSLISLLGLNYFQINSLVFRIIMNFFVFFIGLGLAFNYKNFKKYLVKGIIFFGLINSVVIVVQHILNEPYLVSDYILRERGFYSNGVRVSRSWGLQGEPLAAATVTMVSIIMVVDSFLKSTTKLKKLIMLISLVVMMSALYFTFSRGSLLALALAGIYWLFKKRVIRLKVKRILFFIFISPILAVILLLKIEYFNVLFLRFEQLTRDNSFFTRWDIINSTLEITNKLGITTIFGLGAGSSVGIRHITGGALDNQYLNVYYETGIIGLLILGVLFISLLRKANDITLKVALFALICNMITYELFYYSSAGTLFWLLLGVITSENFINRGKEKVLEPIPVVKKLSKQRKKYRIVW